MSDRPWSYPRYRVEFSEISLNSPGQWTWNMEGLPAVPLTLKLEMVNKGDYEALGKCRTYVECVLTEQNGKEIGAVRGPLLSWTLAWVPANDTGDFWHPWLQDMELSNHREYTLTILVKDVDPTSPPIRIKPTLTGGGWELSP